MEWELMPLGLDQSIGAVVWSPLGWGRLTGRVRRDRPTPTRRLKETTQFAPPVDDARLHRVVDALDEVAAETGKTVPQVALNWLLQRPTVATVLIGARNEEQLRDNLGAVGCRASHPARQCERARAAVPLLSVLERPVHRTQPASCRSGFSLTQPPRGSPRSASAPSAAHTSAPCTRRVADNDRAAALRLPSRACRRARSPRQ